MPASHGYGDRICRYRNSHEVETRTRALKTRVVVVWFGSYFGVSAQVQAGRRALLRKDFDKALEYFLRAAQKDPKFVVSLMHFNEGIWTFVGRTQYMTGRLLEARQSLEKALIADQEDILARIYWGLALLRDGHRTRGVEELQTGLQRLHDWLDHIDHSRPFEPYWDPDRSLRSEILKTIAMAAQRKSDESELVAAAEWIGAEFEKEIDRARRDESRQWD